MASKADRYTYRVTWSDEDGEFVGLCAEFPSLSHLDQNQNGAWNGIRQLVADVLDDMKATGEKSPEPIALRKYSGEFITRVSPELHRRLALEAAEVGESMNKIVAERLAGRERALLVAIAPRSPQGRVGRALAARKVVKKSKQR